MKRAALMVVVALGFVFNGLDARADDAQFTKLLMKKGDKLYLQRAGAGKAAKAQETYEKALAVAPESTEVRWKLARILYWIGTHTKSTDKQMKIFEQGIRYCQEAIKLDESCVECQFWLGVSYGMYGEAKGVLQSLGLVPHMKKSMNKVIKLSPKYDQGGAYRVLGRMYYRLPGINGGDNDKAIELLKKALKIGPNHLMNHRFIAEVYLDEDKDDEAKKHLKIAIDMAEADYPKREVFEMRDERDAAKKLYAENWKAYW